MEFQELKTELYCIKCEDNQLHVVTYLNQRLYKTRCEGCGHELILAPGPREVLYNEFLQRIVTKPERISRELKENPRRIVTLPYRVISKPYRMYKEMRGLRRFIDRGKRRNGFRIG